MLYEYLYTGPIVYMYEDASRADMKKWNCQAEIIHIF